MLVVEFSLVKYNTCEIFDDYLLENFIDFISDVGICRFCVCGSPNSCGDSYEGSDFQTLYSYHDY